MTISIKRRRGTVELCEDFDLYAEWERAQAALADARRAAADMLVQDAHSAAERVTAAEKAMQDSILVFELEALPRKKWRELQAAHPPREDVPADRGMDADVSTFFDAVLTWVDEKDTAKRCIIGVTRKSTGETVDFDPATEWMDLADEMAETQFDDFALEVTSLNRGETTVPFSQAASRVIAASSKNSSSPSA